jgi:hypothetical protein
VAKCQTILLPDEERVDTIVFNIRQGKATNKKILTMQMPTTSPLVLTNVEKQAANQEFPI